ncbi:hypothetical protein Asi02nite_76880 [Asanoa siamensis]|uniref:Uncharacterized protein n=1 Tax=Asanoa siamensis TaxID=926357 RepID=A0ABQ4D3Q3_9ACTN|nr:hypothetical protein Asi02nite_76880 [Asanoa siamensis]
MTPRRGVGLVCTVLAVAGCASTVDGPPTPTPPPPAPVVTSVAAEPEEFGPDSVRVVEARAVGATVALSVDGPPGARYGYRDERSGRTGRCTQVRQDAVVEVTCAGVGTPGSLLVTVDGAAFTYEFEVRVG